MPQCSCFHNYKLSLTSPSDYALEVDIEGQTTFLKDIIERVELAQVVSGDIHFLDTSCKFTLSKVKNEAQLRSFLDLLKSRIAIDLTPEMDECYALAPFSVSDKDEGRLTSRSQIGEMVHLAKNRANRAAADQLCQIMASFVSRHPRYAKARFVAPVPPTEAKSANLPRIFAQAFAEKTVINAQKTRPTRPQKELLSSKDEEAPKANISNSMRVPSSLAGEAIIVVDDICGSSATLNEVARACRAAGAKEVLGLVAAKDATFLQGRVSLWREKWQ